MDGAAANFIVRAPRQFAEVLGKLLWWCGEDKIIYGSEAPSARSWARTCCACTAWTWRRPGRGWPAAELRRAAAG
jgi:hypothetical protein